MSSEAFLRIILLIVGVIIWGIVKAVKSAKKAEEENRQNANQYLNQSSERKVAHDYSQFTEEYNKSIREYNKSKNPDYQPETDKTENSQSTLFENIVKQSSKKEQSDYYKYGLSYEQSDEQGDKTESSIHDKTLFDTSSTLIEQKIAEQQRKINAKKEKYEKIKERIESKKLDEIPKFMDKSYSQIKSFDIDLDAESVLKGIIFKEILDKKRRGRYF